MMTVNQAQFQRVNETGWRRGLSNLLGAELSSWFASRRWLTVSLIWVAIINGALFVTISAAQSAGQGEVDLPDPVEMYAVFGGIFVSVGVIIAMQGAIIGDRKSGAAAWIMSKPVTRVSFIISKLLGNTTGIIVTSVLIPGIIAFVEISMFAEQGAPPLVNFAAGMLILALHAFFWLTLTLMLGTLTNSLGVVMAIPLALVFGQQALIGMIPALSKILPLGLVVPMNGNADEAPPVVSAIINGDAPASWGLVIAAVVLSGIFVAVSIWRFSKQEF